MTFICPSSNYDRLDSYEKDQAKERLRECVMSVQESLRDAKEQERLISAQRNRIITFRFPKDQLDRLDAVASDAATSRGHMLRQIIATYLCYIDENDITYNGSLI